MRIRYLEGSANEFGKISITDESKSTSIGKKKTSQNIEIIYEV